MPKSFKQLKNKLSSESQKRIDKKVEAVMDEMPLVEQRQARNRTQKPTPWKTNRGDLIKK